MTLKVIHRWQAFSNAIRRTFVQNFTRFQLTVCSCGSSALAELHVLLASLVAIREKRYDHQMAMASECRHDRSRRYVPIVPHSVVAVTSSRLMMRTAAQCIIAVGTAAAAASSAVT